MRPGEQNADLRLDWIGGVLAAAFLVTVTPAALGSENLAPASYPLAVVAGLAFTLRRRAPLATVAIIAAAIVAYLLVNEDGGPIFGSAFVALGNLAARRPLTRQWLGPTVVTVAVLTGASVAAIGLSLHELPLALLLAATPRLVADRTRSRELREAAIEQEAARRLVEERLRIAREVHDVVGHGLSTIALRAGVANHVMERDPREAHEALRAIRSISTQSLAELGGLLDVLRAGEPHERAPVPDLDQLPGLVERMRQAGMAIDLEVEEEPGPLAEIVAVAAYRIVQEALTNVARHAGEGARAGVRLARRGPVVEVEVVDDGHGAQGGVREGRGLAGMRERAAALGGDFEAGTRAGGGFRVWATLPVPR